MNWRVKYVDFPKEFQRLESEIMPTIRAVFSKGDLVLRSQLRDFETHFAAFIGARFFVGMGNGTDTLHMSLRAAGVGPGDEVISVSHTFVATIAAIHYSGATPVLVDIADDHNINVDLIESAITPRTKAIMPVSLNGRCCDFPAILDIAKRHGLLVLEDTAQAHGASVDGKKGGTWGLAGSFSFYPSKVLGAFGDAGGVSTSSEEIAQKLRYLRDFGRMPNGDIFAWALNSRLDNVQAALLDLKLPRLPQYIGCRRKLAARYHEGLSELRQVRLLPPPVENGRFFDVYENYEIEAEDRDRLVAHLTEKGIETMLPWGGRGVHQFKALGLTHHVLPRTEQFFQRAVMLPMHTELEMEQADYVVEQIRAFYRGKC
jgi:dTDP-4-amino-4,6-dideoxygalactose transaminase